MKQPSLFEAGDVPPGPPPPPDQAARDFAIEPHHDVVLEASAGTGKTRVLVDRYVRLIEQGVDPRNILAITFTRKAAAEMRERVLVALRRRALENKTAAERWHVLRDRISDIQISTIDAFCFGLLREFPLEANVEPGFDIADETEMGRFGREAMERALRIARGLIAGDEALRLLFTRVKTPVLSRAVEELLDRRHVALPAVAIYVKRHAGAASAAEAADAFVRRLQQIIVASSHRTALLDQGPLQAPEYRWLQADLTSIGQFSSATDLPRIQQLRRRLERYFLTSAGEPRKKAPPSFKADQYASKTSKKAHDEAVLAVAPLIHDELRRLEESINALLAHGLLRLLHIAASAYETLLEEHGLLDFAGMLDKSVELLSRQEEFARSRLKLQSRYHHVLVDEFQDTSRQQWRLIELLVDAWGEGEGVTDAPTSIFIVGDRKQSIYRFRHAEVTLLDEAARKIAGLRPGRPIRQVITTSFRAVPELLTFVNAMAAAIQSDRTIPERFTYDDRDRFPAPGVADGALRDGEPVLGLVAERSMAACASAVAAEIDRLVGRAMVRTKDGPPRHARPDDIAILFRARAGHQYFETALESRGIRTYVYKGLGFFDAPEVQDLQALMRFLAQPDSDLRAAEFLRSRFVRLSDAGLARLAPGFAEALLLPSRPAAAARLDQDDLALLDRARQGVADWRPQADRLPPSELVDRVLRDSAYMFEMRGRRLGQARENVKKVRALVRRVESRGYATLGRIAEYFETLRAGDESNAILEASGCVNLMTMHAAKGLEFPIVFLVNLQAPGRGRGGGFTLVERGPQEEPEVAFTSNEATALEDAREAEELRRLFYVGATRARDRLYFAAQLDARGQLRRAGRSLAGLLPQSVLSLFAEAAASPDLGRVTWTSPEGRFTFSVCRAQDPSPILGDVQAEAADADEAPLDIAWLEAGRPAPVAATVTVGEAPPAAQPAGRKKKSGSPVAHERLIGTIVHRLFQRQWDPSVEMTEAGRLPDLGSAEELVDVADPASVVATAADTYVRLRQRPDVQAVLAEGSCYYEVPFSLADPALAPSAGGAAGPPPILRGVIDCLVVPDSGPPTVLEFKTGGPRAEHEAQAARYAQAVQAILGTNRVNFKILYA